MISRFTILLPIHRPPTFLRQAIRSILAQTVSEFELFVICDGAPPETLECAEEFARADPRVKVRNCPKDSRYGEALRHEALEQASGAFVAYLEDDDLWFPDHLEALEKLLAASDFGHTIHVTIAPDGNVEALPSDLAIPAFRQLYLDDLFNRFGLTVCGHRLESYRRLAEGWAATPLWIYPDLHMWRKFMTTPDFNFGTRMQITAITLPGYMRRDMSLEEQEVESRRWLERVLDPDERAEIIEQAWRSVVGKEVWQELEVRRLGPALQAAETILASLDAPRSGAAGTAELDVSAMVEAQREIRRLSEAGALAEHALVLYTQRTDAEIDKLKNRFAKLESEHNRLQNSRSWQLTKPLRWANRRLRSQ